MSGAYLIIKILVSRLEEDIYFLQTICSENFYRELLLFKQQWLHLVKFTMQESIVKKQRTKHSYKH